MNERNVKYQMSNIKSMTVAAVEMRSPSIPRANIQPGATVRIVQKQDQRTGKMTTGIVARILTRSATHPHGIKVMLEDGTVGRVKEIVGGNEEGTRAEG